MKPLDLKELYGDRYKTAIDESSPQSRDPWYFQVLCERGHIYPVSDKTLGFWCTTGKTANKLHADHPEIPMPQDGDGEAVFVFTLDQFDLIAKYAKPRKRHRHSPEARRRLGEQLRAHRFLPGRGAAETALEGQGGDSTDERVGNHEKEVPDESKG